MGFPALSWHPIRFKQRASHEGARVYRHSALTSLVSVDTALGCRLSWQHVRPVRFRARLSGCVYVPRSCGGAALSHAAAMAHQPPAGAPTAPATLQDIFR